MAAREMTDRDLMNEYDFNNFINFDRLVGTRTWTPLGSTEEHAVAKKNIHVGQYKLFLADILALARAKPYLADTDANVVVIVAGSSPGLHWVPLVQALLTSNLQDRIHVRMFDGADACAELHAFMQAPASRGRVTFQRRWFDMALAEQLKKTHAQDNIVFLCDIRSAISGQDMHDERDEILIQQNMQLQKDVVELMRPVYSCLKFRAPHATKTHTQAYETFPYLAGTPCLQGYHGETSAELRLHVTQADINKGPVKYDPTDIEQKMFYYNTKLRTNTHTDEHYATLVWNMSAEALGIDREYWHAKTSAWLHVNRKLQQHMAAGHFDTHQQLWDAQLSKLLLQNTKHQSGRELLKSNELKTLKTVRE